MTKEIFSGRYNGQQFLYWILYAPHSFFTYVFPVGWLIFIAKIWLVPLQKLRLTTQIALVFVSVAALLSYMCFELFNSLDGVITTHISTVHLNYATYHLGEISMIRGDRYLLYECDNLGLMCEVVYRATEANFVELHFEATLVSPSFHQAAFELQIDGETVYTAPRFSR